MWQHSPKSEIVLFIDKISERARDIFTKYSVLALPFKVEELEPERMRKWHPSTSRWPLLLKYFEDHSAKVSRGEAKQYKRVVLADIRDMYFQSDPFALVDEEHPALHVFHGDKTIGEEGWNRGDNMRRFDLAHPHDAHAHTKICAPV